MSITNAERARRRHDMCVDDLVERLSKKPGFLNIHSNYVREYQGKVYVGEYDVHKMVRGGNGELWNHYYECKSRNSPVMRRNALRQFKRHATCHQDQNWKYIRVVIKDGVPISIKRVPLSKLIG